MVGTEFERKERRQITMGVVKILYLGSLLCLCFFPHGKTGELEVTMLDVGQGDGLFLRGPEGTTYFIDGGSSDTSKVGKYRLEPFLESQGVGTLDYVFVSHGDADHMNGIEELLQGQQLGVEIRFLVLPVEEMWDDALTDLFILAKAVGTEVITLSSGMEVVEGELSLACLQPDIEFTTEKGNAGSMVLSLSYKEFDMLFTGDVEGTGEEKLIEHVQGHQYDVLKVAHHGSKILHQRNF